MQSSFKGAHSTAGTRQEASALHPTLPYNPPPRCLTTQLHKSKT
jgi:hypothetical protein